MRCACFALLMPILLCECARAGVITISELLYDAGGQDDGFTFIEIYGPPGMLLDGVLLLGVNGRGGGLTHRVALDGYRVPLDRFLVLADGAGGGGTGVPGADYVIPNLDFQNGPDSVQLKLGETVLDSLGYGTFGPDDIFAGEGRSAADPAAGSSLARLYADLDTNDNSRDFYVEVAPSPGTGLETAGELLAPEPGSLALLGLGLLTLRFARRKMVVSQWVWKSRRGRRSQ